MKDNISKISSEVSDMNPYKQSGNRDSYSSYNEGWADACDVLEQSLLEQLLTEPARPSDNQKSTEELCECGHARQYHGKSHSINYTEGKCMKCKCEHFVIDNQSNLTKAKGIVRNWLHIKPKDEHKLIFAMKEIDELYHATQHHTPTEKAELMGAKEIEEVINSFFPTDIKNESEEWNIAQVNKRFGARVMLQRYATSVKDAQVQDGEE